MAWTRTVLSLVSPRWRPASTCEACGEAFTCGAGLTGCWCQEVKVPAEARAELRTRYSKCLCRKCLEEAAYPKNASTAAGSSG